MFGWTTTLLAHYRTPKGVRAPWLVCINAGVCGPLHVLAAVKDTHVLKLCPHIELQIYNRSLLLSALLASSLWISKVDTRSSQYFLALMFNTEASPFWLLFVWMTCWLCHAATGYAAVDAIRTNQRNMIQREKGDAEQAGTAGYGTFPSSAQGNTASAGSEQFPAAPPGIRLPEAAGPPIRRPPPPPRPPPPRPPPPRPSLKFPPGISLEPNRSSRTQGQTGP